MKLIHLEDTVEKQVKIARILRDMGESDITWVATVEEGIEEIEKAIENGTPFQMAISDMHYPLTKRGIADEDAGEIFLAKLKERKIDLPVIICSSIRLRMRGTYGCLWYSELTSSDWEMELRNLIQQRKNELKDNVRK